MYSYPPKFADSSATAEDVHRVLKSAPMIARRAAVLSDSKFVADCVLSGRYQAVGGGIVYETGGSPFPAEEPEIVTPGASYPQTAMTAGEVATATVNKWGQQIPVTDEAIARLQIAPVDRALNQVIHGNVRNVDSAAMGVIASKVTQTFDCGTTLTWDDGLNIVRSVLQAKATLSSHGLGLDADTVVLSELQYASAMAELVAAGVLPRDGRDNPLMSGGWPEILGLTWLSTPYTVTDNPFLCDATARPGRGVAGRAELLVGHAAEGLGVEVLVKRDDDRDQYLIRGRRVTVPVVLEPLAGIFLTNTNAPTS